MTRDEWRVFLLEGTWTAKLATCRPWTTRIAKRYMGAEQAEAYGKRNAVEGELLVRVPLTKVTVRKGVADW